MVDNKLDHLKEKDGDVLKEAISISMNETEIDKLDIFIRNNKYLNALYTKVYTDRINITVDNKNYSGTFYDIIIPDYIENFSQALPQFLIL